MKKLKTVLLSLMIVIGSCYPTIAFAFEENQNFYEDPFGYTSDGQEGAEYPTDGTNQYNNKYKQETVVNYDFNTNHNLDAVTGATVPATTQLLKGSTFEGGYHEYRDEKKQASVFTKKIVKPTQNPNVFDIQLDVISGKKETKEKIDIAFVLDKSGSMENGIYGPYRDRYGREYYEGESRWTVLKKSFNSFTNRFIENPKYDVNFGMSSFSSEAIQNTYYSGYYDWYGNWIRNSRPMRENDLHVPKLEIGKYNDGSYFTNNSRSLMNNPILQGTPSGGTPTFIGVEGGLSLFTDDKYNARDDSKKFIIFITDGRPTFDLSNRFNGMNDLNKTNQSNINDNYVLNNMEYKVFQNSREMLSPVDFIGNGTEKGNDYWNSIRLKNYNNLLNYIPQKYAESKQLNIKKYAIGIGQDAVNFKDVLDAIGDGPKGSYLVTNDIDNKLSTVFKEIENNIVDATSSISNGTIVDGMSEFVTLKPDTVATYQLKLKDNELKSTPVVGGQVDAYAKNAVVQKDDNQISVSNLTLSGDQTSSNGYRLTYQVELKPEFRNGHFYPANQPTFIYDDNNPKGVGFAVPSIKNNIRDISVEKKWKGDQTLHPSITLSLYANDEFKDEVTLNNGETKHVFKNYPILDDKGEGIEYKITETPVEGYKSTIEKTDEGNFVVTNTPVGQFTATKEASKSKLIPGETFKYKINVTNTVKDSVLKNIFVEDTMPEGIDIVGNLTLDGKPIEGIKGNTFKITIPELLGKQTAMIEIDVKANDKTAEGIKQNIATVINPEDPDNPQKPPAEVEVIRESHLLLKKTDLDGKKLLPDAEFELVKISNKEESTMLKVKTNQRGEVPMTKLKTGQYLIREVKAPEGYQLLDTPIEFHITNVGELILDKSPKGLATLSINKELKQFELTVKNEEELPEPGILPETGGFGHGKFILVASILMVVSAILSIYFLYHRRKEWR